MFDSNSPQNSLMGSILTDLLFGHDILRMIASTFIEGGRVQGGTARRALPTWPAARRRAPSFFDFRIWCKQN